MLDASRGLVAVSLASRRAKGEYPPPLCPSCPRSKVRPPGLSWAFRIKTFCIIALVGSKVVRAAVSLHFRGVSWLCFVVFGVVGLWSVFLNGVWVPPCCTLCSCRPRVLPERPLLHFGCCLWSFGFAKGSELPFS